MAHTVWVICGAGSGVGKTHLAQQLCAVLPNAIYAKQGHGERRADGPANFYRTDAELDTFIADAATAHDHIVIESNERARRGTNGVTIFIDGVPGLTDLRDDREQLREAADIEISAAATINSWKRVLRKSLPDAALGEVICDCLMRQQRHLFGGRPQARVKLWIEEGGMHIFGAGLARLLEQIDRHGTLRGAAEAAHMSYRHAWGLLKN
ncbi:MAG: hypothetical protein JXO22_04065, partial [Phycisphaerae bacterium]|nr:hypothetical protein [Phycisphaerae bacterium]